jgi:membrane-associated phospholipid phosphatase
MKKGTRHRLSRISIKAIGGIILFLVLLVGFSLVAHEAVAENEDLFDSEAFHFFEGHSPGLINFYRIITFFGTPHFLLPAYILLLVYLLRKKQKTEAINVVLIVTISTGIMFGMKEFFARERPELPLFKEFTNYSFPSGHAFMTFIFCSILGWLIAKSALSKAWKTIGIIFLAWFALTVGISRIALRYHFASDVMAGFCLGIVFVMLFFYLESRFRNMEGIVN